MQKIVNQTNELEKLAELFRYLITESICNFGTGHLGGSLSLVEIIITLYYRIMQVRPEEPNWEQRDRLVLSKGHAGPVAYAALAHQGFFPRKWLKTLNQNGTRLPSHMDQNQTPGVDMTTGSLGQGLSCACGIAYAAKLNKQLHTTFCIIGDGESDEGQNWEAALFAAHHQLDNIVAICDYNKLQIDGSTQQILNLDPLADKWRSFGWETFEVDGHDWKALYTTINEAKKIKGKPAMIIAHTIKGKGNRETEGLGSSHNVAVPDQAAYERFMDGLDCRHPEISF
jgi:transketolase